MATSIFQFLLRSLVALVLVGVASVPTPAATGPSQPSLGTAGSNPWVIRIEAFIDGRSELHLRGNTAQWLHRDFAAPGRHFFAHEPTIINGIGWQPNWPDIPDAENRFCNCFSDTFPGVTPALPLAAGTAVIRPIQSRGETQVSQIPTQENDYTLIVDFNDNLQDSADWYIVEIDFYPEYIPFESFELDTMHLWFGASGLNTDGYSLSGHFALGPGNDGLNPPEETFNISVGRSSLTIPPGAWVSQGSQFFWSGNVDGSPVEIVIEDQDHGNFSFGVRARLLDLSGFTNPETIRLTIGNDKGATAVRLTGRLDLNQGLVLDERPK